MILDEFQCTSIRFVFISNIKTRILQQPKHGSYIFFTMTLTNLRWLLWMNKKNGIYFKPCDVVRSLIRLNQHSLKQNCLHIFWIPRAYASFFYMQNCDTVFSVGKIRTYQKKCYLYWIFFGFFAVFFHETVGNINLVKRNACFHLKIDLFFKFSNITWICFFVAFFFIFYKFNSGLAIDWLFSWDWQFEYCTVHWPNVHHV